MLYVFENKEPFDAALRVVYWFSTKDETLSCTSNLGYAAGGLGGNLSQKYVVYDLLRNVIGERKQDGYTFPTVSFRGDSVYFASSGFARPLMGLIWEILEKVGSQAMGELNILYRETINQRSRGENSDTTIQQRVFQEAYKQKLENELTRGGFLKPELVLVK